MKQLKNNGIARLKLNKVQLKAKHEVDNKIATNQYKFEEICCPICGSENTHYISNKGQFYLPINVVICKQCGLTYLNPRWNKNSYLNFYAQYYDKFYRASHIENNILNVDNKIIKRIPLNYKECAKNILDIGSGKGDNLINFRNSFNKINLFAIETSVQCQKILQNNNIQIISNSVDTNWEENYTNKFDIIIMRHVLEHFMNPISVLSKVRKTLSGNGILYIAVPNNLNPTQKLKQSWFRAVHTFYFNKFVFKNLFDITGFSIIDMKEEKGELYALVQKNIINIPQFSNEHYIIQKNLLENLLKEQSSLIYFIKNWKQILFGILQILGLKPKL